MKKRVMTLSLGTFLLVNQVHAGLLKTPIGAFCLLAGAISGKKAADEYTKTETKEMKEKYGDVEKKFATDFFKVAGEVARKREFCSIKKDELEKSWGQMKEKYQSMSGYALTSMAFLSIGLKLVRK